MIHERMGLRLMQAAAVSALGLTLAACEGKQPPPAPAPSSAPGPQAPEPHPGPPDAAQPHEPESPAPAPAQTAPEPTIPDEPLAGVLGGEPFALRRAERMGTALRLAGEGDYAVTLVFFNEPDRRSWSILEPAAFGAPHLHVRTPGAVAVVMEGYRMLLELDQSGQRGGIWLELPDQRGSIAGTFTIMPSP